jgi:hypothetical protein
MANEQLVATIKQIMGLAKGGKLAESYAAYRELFASPVFPTYRPEDQRQALKIMILAKGAPRPPTPAMIDAHRAAVVPLTELVSAHGEPSDHELLGICHLMLGNEESASRIYRAGLALERERNPQSDLCGELMKRISLI